MAFVMDSFNVFRVLGIFGRLRGVYVNRVAILRGKFYRCSSFIRTNLFWCSRKEGIIFGSGYRCACYVHVDRMVMSNFLWYINCGALIPVFFSSGVPCFDVRTFRVYT